MGFVSPRDCHAFGSQKPLSVIARSDSDEAILGQAAQSRPAEIATPTSWARNDGRGARNDNKKKARNDIASSPGFSS